MLNRPRKPDAALTSRMGGGELLKVIAEVGMGEPISRGPPIALALTKQAVYKWLE